MAEQFHITIQKLLRVMLLILDQLKSDQDLANLD
jgi:hypothetical protein